MPTCDLADNLRTILPRLLGEQFSEFADQDGDVHFQTMLGGVPVGLVVEPWGEDESLLIGFHLVGVGIEDMAAAAAFVATENLKIRVGRMDLADSGVVFTHQLFGRGVNTDTVRELLGLVAGASRLYGELAEKTGALTLADFAAIHGLGS